VLAYSRAEAAQLPAADGARPYVVGILVRPALKCAYRLLLWGAWRDGWRGVVKVGLESLSDSLVWIRVLLRRLRSGCEGASGGGHFSAATAETRTGPPRLVTVARGAAAAARAADWAARAASAGSDTMLITDVPPPAGSRVRSIRLERLGPARLVRAMESQHQLRAIDATVPAGAVEGALLRLVPKGIRGLDGPGLRADPRDLGERVLSELR
jgi:hypothetical protein